MPNSLERWIPGLDPVTGMLSLPPWAAGALAALFVVFCLLALSRASRDGMVGVLGRVALVLVGAGVTWFILDDSSRRHVAAERHALDTRIQELAVRALTPGSALACLDATAGETVEAACENALFASAEAAATAVSYVSAQLVLLTEGSEFARRFDPAYGAALTGLRQAAELDRFGIVAHVLATRDGCTPQQCAALALLRDPSRVSANMVERTYDFYVVRHANAWPAVTTVPAVALSSAPTANTAPAAAASPAPGAPGLPLKPPGPNVFFPSAASIPPVNIMTPEPPAPAETGSTGSAPKQPAQQKRATPAPPPPVRGPVDINPAGRPTAPAPALAPQ